MVTGKDEDVLGVMKLDVIQILGDRVGSAGIPSAAFLGSIGRQDGNARAALVQIPSFAGADIGMEQIRTILRQNANGIDPRVGAVRERKVDNPELSAKGDCRLSDLGCERPQPAALSSREEHRDAFFLTHRTFPLNTC
jgi:hypothetical protein